MAAVRRVLSETNTELSPGKRFKSDTAPCEQPLLVQRLREEAVLPRRGSAQAAGYDLARFGVHPPQCLQERNRMF